MRYAVRNGGALEYMGGAGGHWSHGIVLTRYVSVGAMNNRAEQRDDGLRQDRHTNRTRGTIIISQTSG